MTTKAAPAPPAPSWKTTQWLNAPEPLTLEQLRGRVVLVHAFQMLCPGCVAHGIPQAKRVAERFAGAPLAVVGLHTVFEHHEAMKVASLEAFLYEYRVHFPVGVDAPDPDGEAIPQTMRAYRMRGTPTTILIDAQGRLRKQVFGTYDDLLLGAHLQTLLLEASATTDEDDSAATPRGPATTRAAPCLRPPAERTRRPRERRRGAPKAAARIRSQDPGGGEPIGGMTRPGGGGRSDPCARYSDARGDVRRRMSIATAERVDLGHASSSNCYARAMARATTAGRCSSALLALMLTACGAQRPRPAAPEAPPEPVTLDVLSYNVWLLPPTARDRDARAERIPEHLLGHDVVVLNEAWEDAPRERIVTAMRAHGFTATPVLGGDVDLECGARVGPVSVGVSLGMNGGVIMLSKWPLIETAERLFGDACVGEDCCAAKGVLYARYRREDGLCLHIFGTHLQNQSPEVGSSEEASAARTAQLRIIRAFIDDKVDESSCPGPVVVAGDLNLRRQELPEAARILRARVPQHFEGPHSYGEYSRRTDPDVPEHLDYVLATEDYAAPLYSVNETRIFRAMHAVSRGVLGLRHRDEVSDLSDHHPVAAHFEWRATVADAHLAWHIGAPPAAERAAFCAADVASVFCPHGLTGAPCDHLEGPRRCVQVVDPASDEEGAFDDYLCYRAARRGSLRAPALVCDVQRAP